MNPHDRWDDWEWEKAAYELGRDSKFYGYDRDKRSRPQRFYSGNKQPELFMDKFTSSQKRVVLSALFFLTIVFSSRGEDMLSQGVYSVYRTGMDSGNLYTVLNSMAKEAMGMQSESPTVPITAPVQSLFYPPIAGVVKVGFHGAGYDGTPSKGIEIENTLGTEVLSPADGVIVEVEQSGQFGNMVRINFSNGWEGIIGNLGDIHVQKGDPITMGAKLGTVGVSSLRQKPWLYFELSKDGKAVNPLLYLIQP